MIRVTSYDEITMVGRGKDEKGVEHELKFTWVWAPELSAYDKTESRWLNRGEWEIIR